MAAATPTADTKKKQSEKGQQLSREMKREQQAEAGEEELQQQQEAHTTEQKECIHVANSNKQEAEEVSLLRRSLQY